MCNPSPTGTYTGGAHAVVVCAHCDVQWTAVTGIQNEVRFHSPRSTAECLRRLQDATGNRYFGSWLVALGGGSPFAGKVKSHKVVLERPVGSNRSVARFVGLIEPADGGGTTLRGTMRNTFSPQGGSDSDFDYLVETLKRVAGFTSESSRSA